jgi:anti-sigma factor RsiW
MSTWDSAQIYAYVDGELDAESAARLEADSRADSALAARIAEQRELCARLRAEFDPVLNEPIPERFRAALAGPERGSAVTPIGAAPRGARAASWPPQWLAIAATLAVGVFVGVFASRGPTGAPFETDEGRLVAAGYLDAALSTQLAGAAPEGAAATIGLTFVAAGGEACRTFALQAGPGGLACRRDGRWRVELLDGAASQPGSDEFRQASSALTPAIVGAIEARGAGEPLTVAEEQQRIRAGWDAAPR